MSKYILWDKKSQIIVPTGKIFTKEQWLEKYPMAKVNGMELVINGSSSINGAFCNEYTSFIAVYKEMGCDFTGCVSKQDHLDRAEQFEIDERVKNQEFAMKPKADERIAAALEFQNAMQGYCSEDLIKQNFTRGLWSKQMVESCIGLGLISRTKFQEITG